LKIVPKKDIHICLIEPNIGLSDSNCEEITKNLNLGHIKEQSYD